MSSTINKICIGIGILAVFTIVTTPPPETKTVTRYVVTTPKTVTETVTVTKRVMPDVCVKLVEVTSSIYEASVGISDISTPQSDLLSDARIDIASKNISDLTLLAEKQNALKNKMTAYAIALSENQSTFRSLRSECEQASK